MTDDWEPVASIKPISTDDLMSPMDGGEPLWKMVHHDGHMACQVSMALGFVGDHYGVQTVRKLNGSRYSVGDRLTCDTCGAGIGLAISNGQVIAVSCF